MCATAHIHGELKRETANRLAVSLETAAMSTYEKKCRDADLLISPPQGNVAVLAGTDIPTHTTVGPYPTDIHIGLHASDVQTAELFIEVTYKDGKLGLPNNATTQWLLHVQPARDRHEQNVEVYRDVNCCLHLRFIRAVSKGEQILAWYSDEYARQSGIPILTPANIRGNQQYMCTHCRKTFLYPNSLKAHIHYRCNERKNDFTDDLHKPGLMHMEPILNVATTAETPRRATLPPVTAFLANRTSSNPAKDSIQNWLLMRSSSQKLQTSEVSAFKPHQKLEVKIEPDVASQPSVTRQSEQEALNLSVRESQSQHTMAQTSLAGMSQPIQIFNHIHPPAFPIAIDHAALRLYYPYLNPMHDQARMCCGPLQSQNTLQDQRNPCVSQFSRHLLMTSPGLRLQAPAMNPHCYQNQMSGSISGESSPPAMPYPFPMPSESEGEPLDLIPRSLFTSKSRKGHMCIYCGKLYSRKYGLKIHLRTHTGYKPLKCKVCLRPFGDPSNLNKHVRLHAEGDTPYRCEFCGKVLVRRRDLERHVRSRHPDEVDKAEALETGDVADTTTVDSTDTVDREIVVT